MRRASRDAVRAVVMTTPHYAVIAGGAPPLAVRVSVPQRVRAVFGVETPASGPEPVTVTVARMVRPDRREAFERWADDVLGVARRFPGNLGGCCATTSSDWHSSSQEPH